ncbi:hypothetical protein RRG08_003104 [Elysia crispata]|uniref:Uncharacterized protein n=1 Tax=Elysia crispata TaxID=231223 RepID=A0AAE1ECA1_9GAST|nr:hypothetical protein RRG08_003104 [Elysia crispata]
MSRDTSFTAPTKKMVRFRAAAISKASDCWRDLLIATCKAGPETPTLNDYGHASTAAAAGEKQPVGGGGRASVASRTNYDGQRSSPLLTGQAVHSQQLTSSPWWTA